MRIAKVAIATLLLTTTTSHGQEVIAEKDIVVIARRMRLVRLDYALNGSHLRRCDVEVSSGDARLDRIMCAVLRRCVMAGYREPQSAKLCMDASISMFASGERHPPEPDWADTSVTKPELRPPFPSSLARTAPALGPDTDIVVIANKNKPAAGEWQFTRLSSSGRGHLSQSKWKRCIPDGGVEDILRLMLNGEERRSASEQCGPMKMKFQFGRLEANRSCLNRKARMKTLVRGTVDQDQILAEETTYLVASVTSRPDYTISVPEDDSVSKLYGKRIGECSKTAED